MNHATNVDYGFNAGSSPHFQSLVYDLNSGRNIAVCFDDQTCGNARLFAAAPTMLVALKHILDHAKDTFANYDEDRPMIAMIENAIRKATASE